MVGGYVVIRWVCFCGVSLFGLALNCQFHGLVPGFAELLLEGVLVHLFLGFVFCGLVCWLLGGCGWVCWFSGFLVCLVHVLYVTWFEWWASCLGL